MADVLVKDAGRKGKGVFAGKSFRKGEAILLIDKTAVISKDDIAYLPEDEKNHTMYIGDGKYIVMKAPECYINHSCEPNCYSKDSKIIALQDIKAGEEITTDYRLTSIDPWKMECFCGSKECPGIIEGDFIKKSAEFRKKWLPYLENWLIEEV